MEARRVADVDLNRTPVTTAAAAQKVVKTISGDKAKTQTYCDIGKLGSQIEDAEQKKDMSKINGLNKKNGRNGNKTGPGLCRANDQA